ncbi:MAG: Crp/Fnr family transcriptional regulator [Bdellovibrionota bacterium]
MAEELSSAPKKQDYLVTQFKAGSRLMTENDLSRKMYVIQKGKVRVFKNYLGQKVALAILGEGEVFGELSFFDAEPRSASVEALTDVTLLVIDGDQAKEQIANLPDWILPIFRTIFTRFRIADQQLMVLQNMKEYQSRSFNNDRLSQSIYLELIRFNRYLKNEYEAMAAKGEVRVDKLYQALDEEIGNRKIGLSVFWKQLKEHEMLDNEKEETEGKVLLNLPTLERWNSVLSMEAKSERYLLLSNPALNLVGRIVAFIHADDHSPDEKTQAPVDVTFADIQLTTLPNYRDALREIKNTKCLLLEGEIFKVRPGDVYRLFTYQSILKAFDHSNFAFHTP